MDERPALPSCEQEQASVSIGSLCSGYGGLDLGLMAVIAGRVAWHVENDPDASAVLDLRWPGVPNYGDITTTDWTQVERVDWLTAGYPCQPFSNAGKRLGEDDSRHIWPHIAEAIRALRPSRLLLENVRGHLARGFGTVLGDLAGIGYDARWVCVPASDADAPHRRERVFITAADTEGHGWDQGWTEPARIVGRPHVAECCHVALADARGEGLGEQPGGSPTEEAGAVAGDQPASDRGSRAAAEWGPYRPAIERWERATGRRAPAPTGPVRGGRERLSPRFVEWLMGLPDGWVTDLGLPRNDELRILGNGVVPQQAALALRMLQPSWASLTAGAA